MTIRRFGTRSSAMWRARQSVLVGGPARVVADVSRETSGMFRRGGVVGKKQEPADLESAVCFSESTVPGESLGTAEWLGVRAHRGSECPGVCVPRRLEC